MPLEEKWDTLVQHVRGNKYCFTSAAHYDRIGGFLVQFPGFLWQTQFATLAQWTRTFAGQGGRAKNLVAVLSERLSDEQRRFWSSFDRIRELNATTGELGGVDVQFRVERVPGDGDCGYTVIGVLRDDAANALLKHLGDEQVRTMIGMEIQSMLMDENALPASVRDATIEQLLSERIDAQTAIDLARIQGAPIGPDEEELAAFDVVIFEWCRSVAVCTRFVESYIRNAAKDGYLQAAVHEVDARTSLDALARICDFQVCIWQRDGENAGRIKCIRWINRIVEDGAARNTIHMLHDGHAHFDRLVVRSAPVTEQGDS